MDGIKFEFDDIISSTIVYEKRFCVEKVCQCLYFIGIIFILLLLINTVTCKLN